MNPRQTKAERRELERLTGLAHERELGTAAASLELEFTRWRQGKIDVFELNDHIHNFHNGVSRDLYKLYTTTDLEWTVVSAIARGILQESEVPAALLERYRSGIDEIRARRSKAGDVSPE